MSDKTERYMCQMHPDVHADKPGNCPKCGMHLVKAKEDDERDDQPARRGGCC